MRTHRSVYVNQPRHMPCFSATLQEKKKKGMVDVAQTFTSKEASGQAGLEKTLLGVCRRELQSLAKAHRYPNLLFHCSKASSEQGQSQGCKVCERLTFTPLHLPSF